MAYTNGIFHLDYINGSDAARTALTSVTFSNNGSGGVRATKTAHGLVTGAVVDVTASTSYNDAWKITVVSADAFDLDTAVYSADRTGTVTPRGGSGWADAWKLPPSSVRHQAGDTIRIAKSPDPVSTGMNATWNGGALNRTLGNITGATNASPIVITKINHGLAAGDIVTIYGAVGNTAATGSFIVGNTTADTFALLDGYGNPTVGNGTWTSGGTALAVTSGTVRLPSSVAQVISYCKAAWTPGANISSASLYNSNSKTFNGSVRILTGAGFTTGGLLATTGLPASINLSGYQQVCFWLHINTAITAGQFSLKLYSDVACTVEVESLPVPAIPTTSSWVPITIDKGSALSATVQGVGLHSNVTYSSKTVYIDGIFAVKAPAAADTLSLKTLISKGGATEGWYALRFIDGPFAFLDNGAFSSTTSAPFGGVYGRDSETVPLFKREGIAPSPLLATGNFFATTRAGSPGSLISYDGGWNTGSNVQDGETLFDGINGVGTGFHSQSYGYIHVNKLGYVRFSTGLFLVAGSTGTVFEASHASTGITLGGTAATDVTVQNANNSTTGVSVIMNAGTANIGYASGCSNGVSISGLNNNIAITKSINHLNYSVYIASGHNNTVTVSDVSHGVYISSGHGNTIYLNDVICVSSLVLGYFTSATSNRVYVRGTVFGGSVNYGLYFTGSMANHLYGFDVPPALSYQLYSDTGINYLHDCGMPDTTLVGIGTYSNTAVYSMDHNHLTNNHRVFTEGGTIFYQTTVVDGESGGAWAFSPSSLVRDATYPLRLKIATVACNAGAPVTVTARMRRTHTNLSLGLFCYAEELAGVPETLVGMTASADTWETVSMTFTPLAAGTVDIYASCYVTTSFAHTGYVTNVTATQA